MNQYIILALNLIPVLFIGFGILWGLIRGLRRTASRGIFLIIISIILLFVTIPITNAILKIKVNVSLTVGEEILTGRHSFAEIIEYFMGTLLGSEFTAQNPEFTSFVTAIPLVFINSIIYGVLFWVCKIILYPLDYLFYRLTLAPKKKKEQLSFSAFGEGDENPQALNEDNSQNPNNESHQTVTNEDPSTLETNIKVTESELTSKLESDENSFIKKDPDNVEFEHTSVPTDVTNGLKDYNTKKEKKEKQKKKKIKYKKHRLLGGLVGAVVGLVVMFNTLMPVYGFASIVEECNSFTANNLTDEEMSLSKMTNGTTDEVLDMYNSTGLMLVSKYTGMKALGLAEFDYLTSQKFNNTKITLREDIHNLITTIEKADDLYGKYNQLSQNGIESLTKDQITMLLNGTTEVLDYAEKVGIIDCVSEYLVPVACTLVLSNNIKLTENQAVNDLIVSCLTSLSHDKSINVIGECRRLIDLASYLNSQGLIERVLKNDFSDPIGLINSLDEDFGSKFMTKVFDLQTVSLTTPYLLNIGLTLVDDMYEFGFESDSTTTTDTIKNALSSIIDNALSLAKTIDKESSIYLTTKSLSPLGGLLETIRNSGIVNTNTYKNLMRFAVDQIKPLIGDLLPEEMKDYISNELLENVIKVDNWQHEMNTISSAITKLRDADTGIIGEKVEGKSLRQGTNINIEMKEEVLVNLGDALDILESTCLFGAVTTKTIDSQNSTVSGTISLFETLLDFAQNNLLKDMSNMQDINNVIDEMKLNLIKSGHVYNSENKFWHNELSSVAPLIIEVYDIFGAEEFEITDELGKALDKAKASSMLGNGTTITLVKSAIDIVKDNVLTEDFVYNDGSNLSNPQTLNDKIYELFNKLDYNLGLNATKDRVRLDSQFWTNEINAYIALKNVSESSSNLSSIGDAVNMSSDLDTIYESYTIPKKELNSVIAYAIKENKLTGTDSITQAINTAIDKIADNLVKDEIFESDLTNFWTIELNNLKTLADINIDSEILEYPSDPEILSDNTKLENKLKSNQGKLIELGEQLDSIAFNNTFNNTTGYYIYTNTNSKIVTRDVINEMIADIFSSIKIDKNDLSQTDTTFNQLIEDIITEINSNNADDKIISWARELSYITTLVNLNKDTVFTVDNVATEIGSNLDAIAFNYTKDQHNNPVSFDDVIFDTDKHCTHIPNKGNSLFITREALTNALSGFLNTAKRSTESSDIGTLTEEENNIINEIIDNSSSTIATTNTQLVTNNYHANTYLALNELKSIENKTNTLVNDNALEDIQSITTSKGEDFDNLLQSIEDTKVCTPLLTKKIANLIIKHITLPSNLVITGVNDYYNLLSSHYESQIADNNQDIEGYVTADADEDMLVTTTTTNPFKTLSNIIVNL